MVVRSADGLAGAGGGGKLAEVGRSWVSSSSVSAGWPSAVLPSSASGCPFLHVSGGMAGDVAGDVAGGDVAFPPW